MTNKIKISIHELCPNHFTAVIEKSQGKPLNPSNTISKNTLGADGYDQAVKWVIEQLKHEH